MVESAAVRPVIEATFELADVVEAHRTLEAGGHVGKILLSVSSEADLVARQQAR